MKKAMKLFICLALCLAVVLGIAGCGKKPADQGNTPAPAGGDTMKLAVTTGDGSSSDDRVSTPWYNRTFATNLMFRGLFIADSSLSSVTPDLAEKSEISEDGLTYTITLKDGLKWSDGEALTADDVIWSVETALKATQINSIYTAAFKTIESITAEGNIITIKLTTPYSSMLDVLAQFAILPKHSLEKADPLKMESDPYWTNPVCSGMYTVDEFKVGNYFTLKKNANYEGTAPKIEKVTVYFVSDFITAAQAGNADYVYGNGADFVESMSAMKQYKSNQVDVLFYKYFIFNMKGVDGKENPAMQNVEVRKAIIEAIDRAQLAALYPNATVLNSGVPNSDKAYNKFEYKFNADQAKADIAASGYDTSKPIRICYYNNDQTSIDLINAVVYYLQQAGLKAEATLSNDGTTDLFTTREYDLGFKGKSAFSINEWYTEYMSTDALFGNIFGGDTAFDEAIAELSAATDEESRNAALTKLQALEQEKVYKVPAFTVGTYVYTSNNVKIPEDVKFCNPLYMCDIDFENWEIASK